MNAPAKPGSARTRPENPQRPPASIGASAHAGPSSLTGPWTEAHTVTTSPARSLPTANCQPNPADWPARRFSCSSVAPVTSDTEVA